MSNYIIYDSQLYHHGIKGQQWGKRRFQNADGSLTPAGKKRLQKRQLSDNENWSNRKTVDDKVKQEALSTKEGKAYQDLIKRRGIKLSNGQYKLDYTKDDWSQPDKVLDVIFKDTKIQSDYNKKSAEIAKKYVDEYSGALLKDLKFNDTDTGREYVKKHLLGW